MEQNQTTSAAATQTATKEGYEGDLKNLMAEGKYNISAPLFIMFAEYLGYVGKTLNWVDNWCVAKKKPEPWKQKFIEVEAVTVLREAQKKFDAKRLRELYDQLYEVILKLYDENLASLEAPVDDI